MKFEIIIGKFNDYAIDLCKEIAKILSKYPHKLEISEDYRGLKYEVQSESHIFDSMKSEVVSKSIIYMLYSIKRNYYCENLNKFLKKNRHFIMTRVLIFSDLDIEKDGLLYRLLNENTIVLDGISNFMLAKYNKEWERACHVINLSSSELIDDKSFKDFIKSMSATIFSKHQLLYLFCGAKNMVLSDKLEKISSIILACENLSSDERIISTLIENYPMNVAIYEESKSKDVSEALSILFDTRKKSKSIKSV